MICNYWEGGSAVSLWFMIDSFAIFFFSIVSNPHFSFLPFSWNFTLLTKMFICSLISIQCPYIDIQSCTKKKFLKSNICQWRGRSHYVKHSKSSQISPVRQNLWFFTGILMELSLRTKYMVENHNSVRCVETSCMLGEPIYSLERAGRSLPVYPNWCLNFCERTKVCIDLNIQGTTSHALISSDMVPLCL